MRAGADDDAEAGAARPDPSDRRRSSGGGAVPAGVLGAATGLLVVAVLVVTGHLTTTIRFGEADASDAFIEAWARSRSGSYVVDSSWQRQLDDGATLSAAQRLAQEPGRRIVREFGGIAGEIDGRSVDCYTLPDGTFRCAPDQPTPESFDDSVATEARDVSDAIRSPGGPRYRVRSDDHGCFELTQTRAYPDPTFGRKATLCFDADSGAMRSSERHFDGVVERIDAVSIRRQVQPSDFTLTPDDDFADADPSGPAAPFTVGPDNPGTAPGSTTGSTPGSTPGSTRPGPVAVGDPCQPGVTYDPTHCTDAGLLVACIADGGDIVSVAEAFKRHLSFNDPTIAGTACGQQYARFGLRHGAVPR